MWTGLPTGSPIKECGWRPLFRDARHAWAAMATELEAARMHLRRASAALDAKAVEATSLCAMAKNFLTGIEGADRALQLFGGYGYLADYSLKKSYATSA
jgi:alkylation response protein AidB-like acyl-CoA dehydrogenase